MNGHNHTNITIHEVISEFNLMSPTVSDSPFYVFGGADSETPVVLFSDNSASY